MVVMSTTPPPAQFAADVVIGLLVLAGAVLSASLGVRAVTVVMRRVIVTGVGPTMREKFTVATNFASGTGCCCQPT
jgi:hypothetical protein